MSKTVYLLAPNGNGFLAFGVGCVLTVSEGNVLASTPSGFGICLQSFDRDVKKASGHLALWACAVATAPEGDLLRWDTERGCVVDELAQDEDVFEESFLPVPDALVYDVAQMLNIPTYAPSTEMTGEEAIARAA